MSSLLDIDYEHLSEEAWRQIEEVVATGKTTLKSGVEISVPTPVYFRLVQWLADKKAMRTTPLAATDDFLPKATD